jgi:hypothetical protein
MGMFPALAAGRLSVTSEIDPRYNCIAWAAGTNQSWWWPFPVDLPGNSWPAEVPRETTKESFQQAFETLGYSRVQALSEQAVEQVAIFVSADGTPTHAAYRSTASSDWCSKLGGQSDIEHENLAGVEGGPYGTAALFMERPLTFVDRGVH